MIIIKWRPIAEIEEIPPMGIGLMEHLKDRKGAVKHASCSAWNLLYQVMSDIGISNPIVSFSETGKPYLSNYDLYFSISHSCDLCAVAIADCAIGVDIEVAKDNYSSHLIERSLNDEELAAFDGDFTRIWSRKEAVSKMTGSGLVGFPNTINTLEYKYAEQKVYYDKNSYWLTATVDKGFRLENKQF